MIKHLKKIRKQVLLKKYIMELLVKNNNFVSFEKILSKAIELISEHIRVLEHEIKNLNPKSKIKELDLDSVTMSKSLRKWKVVNISSFQKMKIETIAVLNTCYVDVNNYLAFNETFNEIGEKIVIPSGIRNELKKIKTNYNSLIDDIIILKE